MANTRFGYVRQYELLDALLPGTFMVVRLDGKGFHRFSDKHGFEKPNDRRALDLMNAAASRTMQCNTLKQHVLLAFGESDEYSFLLGPKCALFGRRNSKILTTFVSIFTASYVLLWNQFFPNTPLQADDGGPSFDGRIVLYPGRQEIIDYFKWRQADTHINNLYNTTFWALIQQGGMTAQEAHKRLSGTVSSEKNEILFSQFGVNYNTLDPIYKRGSIILWEPEPKEISTNAQEQAKPETAEDVQSFPRGKHSKASKASAKLVLVHEDMLKDSWWTDVRPYVLPKA